MLAILSAFFFGSFLLSAAPNDKLLDLYRELHRHPELSFKEENTAKFLAKELRAIGLEVTTGVGGHGLVGVLRNGKGPVVMYRTDLDALPVMEKTGAPYASESEGVMHACGHDIHMTTWVGVAELLTQKKSQWKGTVVFVGEPAEEKGEGALALINDGLFKRFPKPEYALAMHVSAEVPVGSVSYRPGYVMAYADSVDVTMMGKGGHGASPHLAIDPITLAAKLVLDVQMIPTREVAATDPVVITVGSFHAGTKHSIIPDSAHLQITVRTFSKETRNQVLASIQRKAKAIALGAGAPEPKVEVDGDPTPSLYNDPKLVEKLLPVLKSTLGESKLVVSDPLMVAEDFSQYYLKGNVPSVMLFLGSVSKHRLDKMKKHGGPPTLHSAHYLPDAEETIPVGVNVMSEALLSLLGK